MGPLIFSSIPNPINAFANHSTLIIYVIWLKFFILKILSSKKKKKKKRSSYQTSIGTLWFWFVRRGWSFSNSLYIKKEFINNFAIKIIIDEVYYVKYNCWAWLWWKILYLNFLVLYIFILYSQLFNFCILIEI